MQNDMETMDALDEKAVAAIKAKLTTMGSDFEGAAMDQVA